MTGGIFGGGVIFVIAAILWTAVLVPSWIRRKEFREAEKHAIRLQRTLRVLAETAEVPEEVRLEANAREALAQEKILRTARRQREAEQASALAAAQAEQVRAEIIAAEMKRKQATMTRAQKLRRPAVRRIRAIGALVALLSILGMLIGVGVAIAGQGFALLLISAVLVAAAAGLLVLLAPGRVARAIQHPVPEVVAAVSAAVTETPVEAVQEIVPAVEDESAQAHARAQAAAREQIDRARAMARARAQQTATVRQNQPESILLQEAVAEAKAHHARAATESVTQNETVAVATPSASPAGQAADQPQEAATTPAKDAPTQEAVRYQQMGVVGDTSTGMLDLDAVLRSRRRAS